MIPERGERFRAIGASDSKWVTNPLELLPAIVEFLRNILKSYKCGGCYNCCYASHPTHSWLCETDFSKTDDLDVFTYTRFYQESTIERLYTANSYIEKQSYTFVDDFPEIETSVVWELDASMIENLFLGILAIRKE